MVLSLTASLMSCIADYKVLIVCTGTIGCPGADSCGDELPYIRLAHVFAIPTDVSPDTEFFFRETIQLKLIRICQFWFIIPSCVDQC